MKLSRKAIRKNRTWNHFLFHCNFEKNPACIDLKFVPDYNPERWRDAFERFQSRGYRALTSEEIVNIQPLLSGQKAKEILLTSLAIESMEYWAKGWGWIVPWLHALELGKVEGMDRLTKVAILRTIRTIRGGIAKKYEPNTVLDFFMRHPGIPQKLKMQYLEMRAESLGV